MKPPRHALRTPPPSPHATAVSARHRRLRCRPDVVCCASSPPSFAARCLHRCSLHAAARNCTARPSARRRRLHCRPGVIRCASSLIVRCTPPYAPSFAARCLRCRSLHTAALSRTACPSAHRRRRLRCRPGVVRCTSSQPSFAARRHTPLHTPPLCRHCWLDSPSRRGGGEQPAAILPAVSYRFVLQASQIINLSSQRTDKLSRQSTYLTSYYPKTRNHAIDQQKGANGAPGDYYNA